jgi:hypothetical protein
VHGDFAAHGRFDRIARNSSAELWLTTHRVLTMIALAGLAYAALTPRRRK